MINLSEIDFQNKSIREYLRLRFNLKRPAVGGTPSWENNDVKTFQREAGIVIPKSIADFFSSESQITVCIHIKNENTGKVTLINSFFENLEALALGDPDLINAPKGFGNRPGIIYGKDISEADKAKIETLIYWGSTGGSNYIFMDLRSEEENPEIYILIYPNKLHKLKLRFWEYIEMFLEARGVFLWEKYFLENTDDARHPAINDHFHQTFAEIFPDDQLPSFPAPNEKDLVPNTYEILASQRNYAERFDRMVEELRKKDGMEVSQYTRWAGSALSTLQKAWYGANGLLDDDMLAFFSRVGQTRLLWRYSVGGQQIAEADFIIPRIEKIFGGEKDWDYRYDWDADINEKMGWKQKSTKGMRLFTDGPYGETLIKFDPNVGKPSLYVLQEDEPFRLTVDFQEYIELLLENGGIWRWQYYLTDPSEYKDLPSPARFRLNMKKIFPEADLEQYRKR